MGNETGWGVPILIADSDADCRRLIASQLERIGCTPYEAAAGPEALALAESVQPALVILDVSLPGITGYEVCHELRDRFGADPPVVFVSGARVEALDRVAGLLIGADDYIVKPFDPDELLARVRRLISRGNGNSSISNGDPSSPDASLTPPRARGAGTLSAGLQQREIAKRLFISPKTVATHIQGILSKLDVHSRAEAVARAHREGLVGDTVAHLLVETEAAALTN